MHFWWTSFSYKNNDQGMLYHPKGNKSGIGSLKYHSNGILNIFHFEWKYILCTIRFFSILRAITYNNNVHMAKLCFLFFKTYNTNYSKIKLFTNLFLLIFLLIFWKYFFQFRDIFLLHFKHPSTFFLFNRFLGSSKKLKTIF